MKTTLTDKEKWERLTETLAAPQTPADLNEIGFGYLTEMVAQLSSSAAAEFLRDYDPEMRAQILAVLEPDHARGIREIFSYAPGSVGAIMAKEFLSVSEFDTIQVATARLHVIPQERKGRTPYVYVVDANGILKGVLRIHDLIFRPKETLIGEIMQQPVDYVAAGSKQQAAANLLQAKRYMAVPVVDANQKLTGLVSADSVIQMIREQANADIAKMVGTGAEEMTAPSIFTILRLRMPWLSVNILSGLLCAFIAGLFEHKLELAVLFLFIPVILGISESTGIQGATIVVRNLSVSRISFKQLGKLFFKEIFVGIVIGLICGLAVGVAAYFWKGSWLLGFALSVSMNVSIIISALIGLLLPILFKAIRVDPAIASGPLVLAVCDIQTLIVYFNLAGLILSRAV